MDAARRRGNIIPYVGGGGHAMFWNIKMQGAMIDFDVPYVYEDEYGEVTVYQIFDVNARESDGIGRVSFGWQAFGGVMIPIGRRMTVDIGGQYFSCPAKFENAFTDFESLDAGDSSSPSGSTTGSEIRRGGPDTSPARRFSCRGCLFRRPPPPRKKWKLFREWWIIPWQGNERCR